MSEIIIAICLMPYYWFLGVIIVEIFWDFFGDLL